MSAPLLEVSDLRLDRGGVALLRGVSFTLDRERLGIVGESGAGKSLTARAILRLLPPAMALAAARLSFAGRDLLAAGEAELRQLRGGRIGLVRQDARFSLNPVMTVGGQIAEAYCAHRRAARREARERALTLLEAVGIREPGRVYRSYPHQLSGGMGQRAMIAMALAPDPELLIADEPTSALDVTIQQQVLEVLDEQVSRRGMALLLISHDLDLVGAFCDRVLVMRQGEILESCAAAELSQARHPYTQRLLAARLKLSA